MEYTAVLDHSNGICTITVTGYFQRPGDSDKLKLFAIDFNKKTGCYLFLVDLRQTKITGGIMSYYNAASPQGDLSKELKKNKTAVLYKELTVNDKFFEDVAINRGFRLRGFDSLKKAVEWLLQ